MTKKWKRILVLRLAILLPLFSIFLLGAYLLLTRYSEDRAAEKRLLGKWELRPDTSDPLTDPPIRIMEWLPNGQTNDYSPEMELWGVRSINEKRFSIGMFFMERFFRASEHHRLIDLV